MSDLQGAAMTNDQQATLEQVAREWLLEQGWCQVNDHLKITVIEAAVLPLAALLAAQRAAGLEEAAIKVESDAILEEAVWAMKQLEFYLPKQLDTEASKTFDRMREFLDSPAVTDLEQRQKARQKQEVKQ